MDTEAEDDFVKVKPAALPPPAPEKPAAAAPPEVLGSTYKKMLGKPIVSLGK